MTVKELDASPALPTATGRIGTAYTLTHAAWTHGLQIRKWWRGRRTYSVTVRADDAIYDDVHRWLLGAMPEEKPAHALMARSSYADRSDEDAIVSDDHEVSARILNLTYDDSREQDIQLRGHTVKAFLERADDGGSADKRYNLKPDTIRLSATSAEGRDVIVAHLQHLLAVRAGEKRRPVLWLLNNWGSWQRRRDLPLRTLESVVLREGQSEELVDDLAEFLGAEADYVRRGIPWHRGYLLYGPPGTGKTSVVKALASHFGLDLWYAPLNDLQKDANLLNLLSEVRQRSILLLEDVDSFHAAREREGESGELSMSGLLNALDGVGTPHGLVTILTTNDRDAIDPALLRPGRVDRSEFIGPPDQDQVDRLFEFFYGRPPKHHLDKGEHTTADLMEIFKRHMDDAGAAESELAQVFTDDVLETVVAGVLVTHQLIQPESICQVGRLHSAQCCVDHHHHSTPHHRCILR